MAHPIVLKRLNRCGVGSFAVTYMNTTIYRDAFICTCPKRYHKASDFDHAGDDIACNGAPFCKVCGSMVQMAMACNANKACAGFTVEPGGKCGYLKTKMQDVLLEGSPFYLYNANSGDIGYKKGWNAVAKLRR